MEPRKEETKHGVARPLSNRDEQDALEKCTVFELKEMLHLGGTRLLGFNLRDHGT